MQRQQTIAAINHHLDIFNGAVLHRVLATIKQLSQDTTISYGETEYDHLMAYPANAEKLNRSIVEVEAGKSIKMSFEAFDTLVRHEL